MEEDKVEPKSMRADKRENRYEAIITMEREKTEKYEVKITQERDATKNNYDASPYTIRY